MIQSAKSVMSVSRGKKASADDACFGQAPGPDGAGRSISLS